MSTLEGKVKMCKRDVVHVAHTQFLLFFFNTNEKLGGGTLCTCETSLH